MCPSACASRTSWARRWSRGSRRSGPRLGPARQVVAGEPVERLAVLAQRAGVEAVHVAAKDVVLAGGRIVGIAGLVGEAAAARRRVAGVLRAVLVDDAH